MIQLFSPRWPWTGRCRSWLVALVLAGLVPALAWSQEEAEEPPSEPGEEVLAQSEEELEFLESVFIDPQAKNALANQFEELYPRVLARPLDQQILQMAEGRGAVNRDLIQQHVQGAAKELTNRRNIEAMLDSSENPNQSRIKSIENAGQSLLRPLLLPRDSVRANFLRTYNDELLEVLPALLENHLFARTQAMLVLSRMGDARALNLLVEQLNNPDQPLSVRMLAANGLTQIARSNLRDLTGQQLVDAAKAVTTFLQENPDTLWLARVRALEALGSLRQPADIQNREQVEMMDTALRILTDSEARYEVRAWAAWTLGMFDIPTGFPEINYSLLAYHIGQLAAELGEEILEASERMVRVADIEDQQDDETSSLNPARERAKYLTGILVYQVFFGLNGEDGVRDSGLRQYRTLGPHASYVQQVHRLVRDEAQAAVLLTRARGNMIPGAKEELEARTAKLRAYLTANPPEDSALRPGGPSFDIAARPRISER